MLTGTLLIKVSIYYFFSSNWPICIPINLFVVIYNIGVKIKDKTVINASVKVNPGCISI